MDVKAVKRLCDIPEADTSYFRPWRLEMLYEVEPTLQEVAQKAVAQKRRRFYTRLDAYCRAKNEADMLLGWNARDPRLRSSGAWDCFFNYILDQLKL